MSAGRAPPPWWYNPARSPPLTARLLAALYGATIRVRSALYDRGWLKTHKAGAPVVIVGNLVAGGSGKTPLVIALVERLRAAGRRPGVATRGYGREDADKALWVEADTDPVMSGDEPLLIARRTGAKVRADRDRVAAARALVAAGCDVIVCDDGLQHYRLARDLEIEVLDAARRHGNGRLLPAGPLREPVERAARCDFHVVNTGSPDIPLVGETPLVGAAQAATLFGEWPMHLIADQATPLLRGRPVPLDQFAGHRVHAVAGIGDPERFFAMLRARGIAVVPHAFPDHHRYTAEDFEFGSDLPVLMTEKDAVKATPFATPRFHAVPVTARLPESFWVSLLDRIA
ncbi:MAG: tetraacyldisaccharide 4'-kinase [Lysobacteraceae bacterium]|nr:MAG: tetraacyldisaccharide 4'-kinase [Xanthomonadaceae bacterium]